MFKVNIDSNINEIINGLNDLEKKQIPYATSLALNNTAQQAMKAMKNKIDKDFGVTASWNKVGGKYGIRKKSSTKKNLEVEIFFPVSNTWITDHERGDVRDSMQLIPTEYFKLAYPSIKTNRAIKKKAKQLLNNQTKHMIYLAPLGNGNMAFYQRIKGKSQGQRQLRSRKSGRLLKAKKILNRGAVPLFLIKSKVKEKARLDFNETIIKVFNKNIDREFYRALVNAMSTAK